jgi:hypothetical protein
VGSPGEEGARHGAHDGNARPVPMKGRAGHDHADDRDQRTRHARGEPFASDDDGEHRHHNGHGRNVSVSRLLDREQQLPREPPPSPCNPSMSFTLATERSTVTAGR